MMSDASDSSLIENSSDVIRYDAESVISMMPSLDISSPLIVSIDGNIGSGKSTIVNKIRTKYSEKYAIVDEPVLEWINLTDSDGISLLEKFYTDNERYSYLFQSTAFITRTHALNKAISSCGDKQVVITERSTLTDKEIFAEMLYNNGKMSKLEYDIYNMWYEKMKIEPHIIIYINTDVETCIERIKMRARPGENIDDLYMAQLHLQHEMYVEKYRDRVFISDSDFDAADRISSFIDHIVNMIKSNKSDTK